MGLVSFSDSARHEFGPQEVDFLSALVSQAATAIKGLTLYRDLEHSRDELEKYAERLEEASKVEHFLARTDPLTGIPNRRYIEEVLATECAQVERYGRDVSVVMVDIDYFKRINDEYGHLSGDNALKAVAALAREICRSADFVGRWGGDEFVFILPSTALDEAVTFAERFRNAVAAADFRPREPAPSVRMTVSLGVAQCLRSQGDNADVLLDRSDKALYTAKEGGRNKVACADQHSAAA